MQSVNKNWCGIGGKESDLFLNELLERNKGVREKGWRITFLDIYEWVESRLVDTGIVRVAKA